MSQVKFTTRNSKDQMIEVVGGWDNPLKGYHLTIFLLPDEDVLWCNLDHFPFPGMAPSTEPLKKTLIEMDINVPDGFWEKVELKEGNTIHVF